MKKVFRISKIAISKANEGNPNIFRYRLEQRFGLLIHFWGSPSFAPPHLFTNYGGAYKCAKEHCPDCDIYNHEL